MKLTVHNKENITLWTSCYLLLVFHASFFIALPELAFRVFVIPLTAAVAFGCFQYFYVRENPHSIDEIVANFFSERKYDAIMNAYKCIPVALTFYVLVMAQL